VGGVAHGSPREVAGRPAQKVVVVAGWSVAWWVGGPGLWNAGAMIQVAHVRGFSCKAMGSECPLGLGSCFFERAGVFEKSCGKAQGSRVFWRFGPMPWAR